MPKDKVLRSDSGQALLLVLLSLAVVLTVGLSYVSRSINDISITSQDEDSLRAFSAAEAGVERALITGQGASAFIGANNEASFAASVAGFSTPTEFVSPSQVKSGEDVFVWFVNQIDTDGDTFADSLGCAPSKPCFHGSSINICWGNQSTPAGNAETPAVEISIFYAVPPGSYSDVRIARLTADPNVSRRSTNKFDPDTGGNCIIGGTTFAFQKNVNFATLGIPAASYGFDNGLQFARITILYNTVTAHSVGSAAPGSTLPSQGVTIQSVGTSGTANRKINLARGIGDVPPVFDGAIFAPGGITK